MTSRRTLVCWSNLRLDHGYHNPENDSSPRHAINACVARELAPSGKVCEEY